MKNWHTYKIEMQTRTGIIKKRYSAVSNIDAIRKARNRILFMEYRNGECLAYEIISMRTKEIVDKHYKESYYDHVINSL